MRWVQVACLVVVVAIGCGESVREEGGEIECTSDLDCAEGQRCDKDGVSRAAQAARAGTGFGTGGGAGAGGTGSAMGGTGNPCAFTNCGTTVCPAGQVCKLGTIPGCPTAGVCQLACTDPNAGACPAGNVCRASGQCEVPRCDEPDFPGCPTGMMCDPTADPTTGIPGRYSLFGTDQYPFPDVDQGPMLTEQQRAAVASRCVFRRCDEAGAYACADGFRCDVANAPATTTGCDGIPCGELGRCSTDSYICVPTSAGPHFDTIDAHGCMRKNCEEGAICPGRYFCNIERATDGTDGCVIQRCDDPGGSCDSLDQKCAPETEPERLPSGLVYEPDLYGCVQKRCDTGEFSCGSGMACDRLGTTANIHGCVIFTDPGVGGSTGSGGTSGTSGTAGEAGATGDPGETGVCR